MRAIESIFYHALDKYFPGMKNKYIRTYGNAYDRHGPNNERLLESDFDKIVKGLAKKKIITFPDYVIMIQLWKIVFYESNKLEFKRMMI